MFLKFLDDMEKGRELEAELEGVKFRPLIEPPYAGATGPPGEKAVSGDDLIAFINNDEAVRPDGQRGPGLFAYCATSIAPTATPAARWWPRFFGRG